MDKLFASKKSPMYDIAKMKIENIRQGLESEVRPFELEKNKWFKILPNDEKSPMIMQLTEKSHLIFYPKNSAPYQHSLETKCKFVEILSGVVYDAISGTKHSAGAKIKVMPGDQLKPYTLENEAYVRVCIADCNSLWNQICE